LHQFGILTKRVNLLKRHAVVLANVKDDIGRLFDGCGIAIWHHRGAMQELKIKRLIIAKAGNRMFLTDAACN
jgi:hypothetical protein